jgi:hypothetical protein
VAAVTIKRQPERDGEVAKDALAFTLTKPIDPAVLDQELSAAMNWRKDAGLVVDGDASEASEDNPVTVWVLRDDVKAATFRSVVGKHERTEQTDSFADLRAKAEAGEDYTSEEVQQVLRLLVLRAVGGGGA